MALVVSMWHENYSFNSAEWKLSVGNGVCGDRRDIVGNLVTDWGIWLYLNVASKISKFQ